MADENWREIVIERRNRVAALTTHVESHAVIPVDGTAQSRAALIDVYQAAIAAQDTIDSLRAQLNAALAARGVADQACRKADAGLRSWVVNTFGTGSQQAHEFGFPPPKPRVISAETKARAAEKLRATRAARHTMGKRQKAAIKGIVESPLLSVDRSNADPAMSNLASGNQPRR